jgi:hypothetical protein
MAAYMCGAGRGSGRVEARARGWPRPALTCLGLLVTGHFDSGNTHFRVRNPLCASDTICPSLSDVIGDVPICTTACGHGSMGRMWQHAPMRLRGITKGITSKLREDM